MKMKSVKYMYKTCSFHITYIDGNIEIVNLFNLPNELKIAMAPYAKTNEDQELDANNVKLFQRLYLNIIENSPIQAKKGFFSKLLANLWQ